MLPHPVFALFSYRWQGDNARSTQIKYHDDQSVSIYALVFMLSSPQGSSSNILLLGNRVSISHYSAHDVTILLCINPLRKSENFPNIVYVNGSIISRLEGEINGYWLVYQCILTCISMHDNVKKIKPIILFLCIKMSIFTCLKSVT